MTDLERLLADPRSHLAVPEREMVNRVRKAALEQWHEERALQELKDPELTAAPSKTSLTSSFLHAPSPRWAVGLLLLTLLLANLAELPMLPRYDMHLKYWWLDVVDGIGAGIIQHPLPTALNLCLVAALVGFALSSRARASLRKIYD